MSDYPVVIGPDISSVRALDDVKFRKPWLMSSVFLVDNLSRSISPLFRIGADGRTLKIGQRDLLPGQTPIAYLPDHKKFGRSGSGETSEHSSPQLPKSSGDKRDHALQRASPETPRHPIRPPGQGFPPEREAGWREAPLPGQDVLPATTSKQRLSISPAPSSPAAAIVAPLPHSPISSPYVEDVFARYQECLTPTYDLDYRFSLVGINAMADLTRSSSIERLEGKHFFELLDPALGVEPLLAHCHEEAQATCPVSLACPFTTARPLRLFTLQFTNYVRLVASGSREPGQEHYHLTLVPEDTTTKAALILLRIFPLAALSRFCYTPAALQLLLSKKERLQQFLKQAYPRRGDDKVATLSWMGDEDAGEHLEAIVVEACTQLLQAMERMGGSQPSEQRKRLDAAWTALWKKDLGSQQTQRVTAPSRPSRYISPLKQATRENKALVQQLTDSQAQSALHQHQAQVFTLLLATVHQQHVKEATTFQHRINALKGQLADHQSKVQVLNQENKALGEQLASYQQEEQELASRRADDERLAAEHEARYDLKYARLPADVYPKMPIIAPQAIKKSKKHVISYAVSSLSRLVRTPNKIKHAYVVAGRVVFGPKGVEELIAEEQRSTKEAEEVNRGRKPGLTKNRPPTPRKLPSTAWDYNLASVRTISQQG